MPLFKDLYVRKKKKKNTFYTVYSRVYYTLTALQCITWLFKSYGKSYKHESSNKVLNIQTCLKQQIMLNDITYGN